MSYEDTLHQLCNKDERIVVMTAENRAVIRGLPEKIGPRFIDVGISEMTLVGAAAGLALRGRVPVIHALACFLTMRAFEFIRTDVGIPNLPVKIVGGFAGFLSEANGPTHQAIEDIALMRGIPNMQVWCPADEAELLEGLPEIMASPSPCYIRYCAPKPIMQHGPLKIGKAETIREGDDVSILSYGLMLNEAEKAAKMLEAKGVRAKLVNMRMLAPADEEAIVAAAKSKLVVTIEDHFAHGGLYAITAELLKRRGVDTRIMPISLEDRWFKPALMADVLEYEQMNAEALAQKILREIR